MTTPFTQFLVALVSFAGLYSFMVTPGNARADNTSAAVPTDLMQWHSGLTSVSNTCVIPEGQQPQAAATQPEDPAVYLAMHRAVGLGDAELHRSDFWFNSFDVSNGARTFPRIPGDNPGVFRGLAD